MAKEIRGIKREQKRRKARYGMRIVNRSIFKIQETMRNRSEEIKSKKK
jgi:hypothetical protein